MSGQFGSCKNLIAAANGLQANCRVDLIGMVRNNYGVPEEIEEPYCPECERKKLLKTNQKVERLEMHHECMKHGLELIKEHAIKHLSFYRIENIVDQTLKKLEL